MTWTMANMQRMLASRGWLPDGDPVRAPAYKKNYYTGEIASINESVTEKRLKRPVSVYIYAADHETSISSYRWPSMLAFLEAVVAGVYMTPHAPNDEMIAPDPPRQQGEEAAQPAMGASQGLFGRLAGIIEPTTTADPQPPLSLWELFCRNESGQSFLLPVRVDDRDLELEIGTNYTVPGYGEGVVHSRHRGNRTITIRFERHDEYTAIPLTAESAQTTLDYYRDGQRITVAVGPYVRWGRVVGGPMRLPDRARYEVRVLLDRRSDMAPNTAADSVVEYITDEAHNGMRPQVGQQWWITDGGGRHGTIQSVTWHPHRSRWAVRVTVDAPQQQPAPARGGLEAWLPQPTTLAFIDAARQQLDQSIAASQRAMEASLMYGQSMPPPGAYTISYTGTTSGSLSGQLSGHQHLTRAADESVPEDVPLSPAERVVVAAREQADRLRRAFHNPMATVVPGRRRRNP